MIQGEVTVPYTPIGGENVYSRISTYDLSGSSINADVEGAATAQYNVSWSLPGGITNKNLGWYLIFYEYDNDLKEYKTDDMFVEKLKDIKTEWFDSSGTFKLEMESNIKDFINELVFKMLSDVFIGNPPFSHDDFKTKFGIGRETNDCAFFM